ncbi:MAG: SAM-dependent methyltransferase [Cytophagaceae bacterium]|nr:SAM-dependent methyltransferase [Cytophagaceae bacterium]|tara:strand:- start:3520 stop:4113 length:594 start_codon:yes stop_codon:yes gene_type:complete
MTGRSFDKNYWENRYLDHNTGWDMGHASPPLTAYIDQLRDKDLKILIPGAGNGHEAIYLCRQGFTDVTVVDIAPSPLNNIKRATQSLTLKPRLIQEDFFRCSEKYDLILEQTFFCALHPSQRQAYVEQMHTMIGPSGKLAGLLFDFPLTEDGPPFGGSQEEYQELFSKSFIITKLEPCYNSIKPRSGKELFFIFEPR